jgi:hypothetical protein
METILNVMNKIEMDVVSMQISNILSNIFKKAIREVVYNSFVRQIAYQNYHI